VDTARVALLRELLGPTQGVERSRSFARAVRGSVRTPGGLLLVGTPAEEPWHLAAHLDDEARLSGVPEITPTLVRWRPPIEAPAHLSIGFERLETTRRGETVFVVAPDAPPEALLERVADARKVGATVVSLDAGDDDLRGLAHEQLIVPHTGLLPASAPGDGQDRRALPPSGLVGDPAMSFEIVSHLVSTAAGEPQAGRRGFRDRLGRLLDAISGPAPASRRD
jgi:hypothetical protein